MTDIKLIGEESISGSAISVYTRLWMFRSQCILSGTLTFMRADISASSGNAMMAIYSDSSGLPGFLLSESSAKAISKGVNTFVIGSINITKDEYYWIAYASDGSDVYGTTSGGTTKYKSITWSGFSFPNPAGSSYISNTYRADVSGRGVVGGVGLVGDGLVGEQVFFGPSKFFG